MSAPGYQSAEQRVQVHFAPTRCTVRLRADRSPPDPLAQVVVIQFAPGALEGRPSGELLGLLQSQQLAPLEPEAVPGLLVPRALPAGMRLYRWLPGALPEDRTGPLEALNASEAVLVAGRARALGERSLWAALETGWVRFALEVRSDEALSAIEAAGLEAIGAVGFSQNAWRVRSRDPSLAIQPLLEQLGRSIAVCAAEAESLTVPDRDVVPSDYLATAGWGQLLCGVYDAWSVLGGLHHDWTFGRDSLLALSLDTGIEASGQRALHPELDVKLTDGSNKISGLYNFSLGATGAGNSGADQHGTNVAVLLAGRSVAASKKNPVAEGVAGVAGNIHLASGELLSYSTTELLAAFLWGAGAANNLQDLLDELCGCPQSFPGLPDLKSGADVLSTSLALGRGAGALQDSAREVLDYLSRRGRRGRGLPMFMSAGNWADDAATANSTIAVERPWAAYERTFACGASTLDTSGREIGAAYSGKGPSLEWCAPSGSKEAPSSLTALLWDPPDSWSVWTGARRYRGELFTLPMFEADLLAQPAKNKLGVSALGDAGGGFVPDTYVVIGLPGVQRTVSAGAPAVKRLGEVARIQSIDVASKTLTLSEDLKEKWTGGRVLCGTRPIGTLKQPFVSGTTIDVLTDAKLPAGTIITIGRTGDMQLYEVVSATYHPGIGSSSPYATIELRGVDGGPMYYSVFGSGTAVYLSTHHATSGFSGTSAATPLAAGIGALALSAQPALTWQELRHILRDSAERIDPSGGGWSDGFSQTLGYGRLSALEAVRAAICYSPGQDRDLWLRRSSQDKGAAALAASAPLESPDIWVRNLPPGSDSSRFQHVDPLRGQDSWIWVRLRNRGRKASHKAWVRFYVAASQSSDYQWPADFNPVSLGKTSSGWERQTYLLGEVAVAGVPGSEGPGPPYQDIYLRWAAANKPDDKDIKGLPFEPHLLVEITPHDGAVVGGDIRSNSNLAQRAVTLVDEAPPEIRFEAPGGGALSTVVTLPRGKTRLDDKLKIVIRDSGGFQLEDIRVVVTVSFRPTGTSTAALSHQAGGWSFSPPSAGVLVSAAPRDTASGALTGKSRDAWMMLQLDLSGRAAAISLEVLVTSASSSKVSGGPDASHQLRVLLPVDVLVLIDGSFSMGLWGGVASRWQEAAEIAEIFRDLLAAAARHNTMDHRIGAVQFRRVLCGDRSQVVPLSTPPDTGALLPAGWSAVGGNFTPIGAAVQRAHALLSDTTQWRERTALLLTDARESWPPFLSEIRDPAAAAHVPSLADSPSDGLRIHAVQLGPPGGSDLAALSSGYSGLYCAYRGQGSRELVRKLLDMLARSAGLVKTLAQGSGPALSVWVEPGSPAVVVISDDSAGFSLADPAGNTSYGKPISGRAISWIRISDPAAGLWRVVPARPGAAVVSLS